MTIRVNNIVLGLDDNINIVQKKVSKKLKISIDEMKNFKIIKESLDARNKDNIRLTYAVELEHKNEEKLVERLHDKDVRIDTTKYEPDVESGSEKLNNRPVVVGFGPAGIFAALMLAEKGYKPLVIERGEDVDKRSETVDRFWAEGKLDLNSNVQFGEGGAGTFSDGKLNTLVKDKEHIGKEVFRIFVEAGAPSEILYVNKPHIGTDLLRNVVINIRKKIIEMGGEFRYNTTLTNIYTKNNKLVKIEVNNEEIIECEVLVLAIGHSARDTFKMLYKNNIVMKPKPFAIGVRIQHPQDLINKSQYGVEKHEKLGSASYKLTYHTSNNRGVYTFCMCPGGYVVNSSSEEKRLAINGMSNHARDSKNANSAILVTITPDDFGNNPLDGIAFQRKLEELTYNLGNGNIPVQLFKDYKENVITKSFNTVEPIFKGNTKFANINEIFPDYMNIALKEGIEAFGHKIKGFNMDDAILAAIESRTSSPVKIERNEEGISNIEGIYPCGEGAGYAGGITSAAMDGIKTFQFIASKYKSNY